MPCERLISVLPINQWVKCFTEVHVDKATVSDVNSGATKRYFYYYYPIILLNYFFNLIGSVFELSRNYLATKWK